MDQPTRFPWTDFPDVLIHASEQHVKQHFGYQQAKAGHVIASVNLVLDSLSYEIIDRMNREFSSYAPVLLPVLAEESAGVNSIPRTMAEVFGHLLKWDVEERVFQANVVGHTGASGFVRLARQPIFKGTVESGLHYVLIDDFIGQGGTLANLRGHILAQGSQVLGASVLTGKAHSARLMPTGSQLVELGGGMEQSNSGGDNVLASALTVSPLPKADISSRLQQAKESLIAWKKLVEEGKVEPLVVQLDSLPELRGKVRMLSQSEQEQLLAGNEMIGDYVRRILNTAPP